MTNPDTRKVEEVFLAGLIATLDKIKILFLRRRGMHFGWALAGHRGIWRVSLITLDIMKLKQLITLTFDKYEKAEEKHTNFQEAITFINLTRGK